MRWSETVTLEFVKIYLNHECLWNPSHPGYKLKYQREKAYSDISSQFKDSTKKAISVPEVKLKIKNLRTTYVQQVHKILKKSSPESIYEPSLIWFHEMDRCLKHVPSNRNSYLLNETQEVDSSSQVWVDHELQTSTEENPDPLTAQTDDEFDPNHITLATVKKERPCSPQYMKFKKKKFRNRTPPFEGTSSVDDEFDVYGKYIAMQLRQMDLHKALRLQLEIQTLVSEARITDICNE